MLVFGLFFICGIFCATAIEIKLSKSKNSGKGINIAVDTMLQFDDQDNSEDLKFINKIHKFIGKVKTVIEKKKIIRHQFSKDFDKRVTFIDFIQIFFETLTQFNDKDLKYFVTVLSDEITKYHYRGCKFYELTENYKFRRFFAYKLDKINSMTAVELRKNLKAIMAKIEEGKYNMHEKEFIELINSVYSPGIVARFQNILTKINNYKNSQNENLTKIVRAGLRMIIFDHYTRLNRNARLTLKSKIADFFNTLQYIPQLKKMKTVSTANKNSNVSKRGSVYNQYIKHHKHVVVRKHLKADKLKPSVTFLPKTLTTNKKKGPEISKKKKSSHTFNQELSDPKHEIETESRMEGATFTEFENNDIDNKGPKILQQPSGWSISPDVSNDYINSDNSFFENKEIKQDNTSYSPHISLLKPKYDISDIKRHYENVKGFKRTPYKKVSPVTSQTFILVLEPKNKNIHKDKSNKPKIAKHNEIDVTVKPPELPYDRMDSKEFENHYHDIEPKKSNQETKLRITNKNLQTFNKDIVDTSSENYFNLNAKVNSNSDIFKHSKFNHNYIQTTNERKHFLSIKMHKTTTRSKGKKLTFKTLYPEFGPQWSGLNTLQIKKRHTQITDRMRILRQRETSTSFAALRINKITNNIISNTRSSPSFDLYKQHFDSIEVRERDDDEMKEIKQLIAREQLLMFRNDPVNTHIANFTTTKNVIKSRYNKVSTVTENISEQRRLLKDNTRRNYGNKVNKVRQFPVDNNNTKDVKFEINNDSDSYKVWQRDNPDSNDDEHSVEDNNKFIRGKPKSKLIIRNTNINTGKEFVRKYEYNTENRPGNNKFSPKEFLKLSFKNVTKTQGHNAVKNSDIKYILGKEIFKNDSQSYRRFGTIQSIKNKENEINNTDSRFTDQNPSPLLHNYSKNEANMNKDMVMEENQKGNKQNFESNVIKNSLVRFSSGGLKNIIAKGFKQNQRQKKIDSQETKLNVKNATKNIVMRSKWNQDDKHVHSLNKHKNNRTTFKTTNGTVNEEKIKYKTNFRSEYNVQNTSKTFNTVTNYVATTDKGGKLLNNSTLATNFKLSDLNAKTTNRVFTPPVTHINPLRNLTSVKYNT